MKLSPNTRDLVLVGGGHCHALVLRAWGMNPLPGARVTVIDPSPLVAYTGMLPGYIAGHYARSDLDIDLRNLARFAGADFIEAEVTGLDPAAKKILLKDRPDIHYDVASLNVGVTAMMPEIPGFAQFATPVRPLRKLAVQWQQIFESGKEVQPDIAIIGAGVGGVEIALAMAHRLRDQGANRPAITLIDAERALATVNSRTRRRLLTELKRVNIGLFEHSQISDISADGIRLDCGKAFPAGFIVGAAGGRPLQWLRATDFVDGEGFVRISETLQTNASNDLFAVGDCARLAEYARPRAGVYAVRQAPVLLANLRARLAGQRMRRFRPQSDYLKLISLGERTALADRSGLTVAGRYLWRLKDRIDRRFMTRLSDLPDMQSDPPPVIRAEGGEDFEGHAAMLCHGCGSKVDAETLGLGLGTGAVGDDAAILQSDSGTRVISTDHLSQFVNDPYIFGQIATVHALGDIWAMGGKPDAMLVTLILPRASDVLHARTIAQIMAGVRAACQDAGCSIEGGHTTQGAELSIGLTVTGWVSDTAKQLNGAGPDQSLILTKPIGSGAILAAAMRGKIKGHHVSTALRLMAQSQAAASEVLKDATAMTDVTGFGLAGHLMNICRASSVGATVALDEMPLMEGSAAVARDGVQSVLAEGNLASLGGRLECNLSNPKGRLLLDPQTSGGLLATLPEEEAKVALDALIQAGYRAAIIGKTRAGPPEISAN